MKQQNIVILGGGGHAKVVASALQKNPNFKVIGFLDDDKSKTVLLGTPRVGSISPMDSEKLATSSSSLAIGIGHIGETIGRGKIILEYTNAGVAIAQVISPDAIINQEVTLGEGVAVFDGAILQPGVTIGDYSIINTKASIDHDCNIGEHVHIAPGATLSGNVRIGNRVLVGTGASIIQGISIADDCIIGAGAVVIKDCSKKGGVYVGSPAKLIKEK